MKMLIDIDEKIIADMNDGRTRLTDIAEAVKNGRPFDVSETVKNNKPIQKAQITEAEYDFLAFYARLLQENPAVAKHIDNMVRYMVSTDLDEFDKGEFYGTFDVLRSAGIVTLHDKLVTRRYIEEAKEKKGVREHDV